MPELTPVTRAKFDARIAEQDRLAAVAREAARALTANDRAAMLGFAGQFALLKAPPLTTAAGKSVAATVRARLVQDREWLLRLTEKHL